MAAETVMSQCKEFEHSWQPLGTPQGFSKDTAWHCLICGAVLEHTAAKDVSEKVVEVQQAVDYDYGC